MTQREKEANEHLVFTSQAFTPVLAHFWEEVYLHVQWGRDRGFAQGPIQR